MEETQVTIKAAEFQDHHPLRVSGFCYKGHHRACTSNKGGKPEEQLSPTCICDCHGSFDFLAAGKTLKDVAEIKVS